MFLLKRPGFELESTSAVIKGSDYARVLEASELLDAAREQGKRIEAEAERVFEQRKEEGYEKGLDEARQEMVVQMFEVAERTAAYLEHIEEQVTKIVVNSLRHIVASLPPDELIIQSVRKALAAVMANQKQVTLRVPHEQVDAVQQRISELLSAFPAITTIEVAADSRLEGTDCILETELGVVEAGAEVQIKAIEKALQKSLNREQT